MKKNLIFSGGGGGGSSPTVTSDNLRNEDNAELLLGLCEGPIIGLENGSKSFYINDTPLQNSDDSYNFTDVELEIKQGDASQDETIKFELGGASKGTSVGLEIKEKNAFISRVTSTANIDYIDVRIGISALYYADSDGNVGNATGVFRIEYKKSNESEENWRTYNNSDIYITGKTTSNYSRDFRVSVERDSTEGVRYQIKVTRLSDKSSDSSTGYFFSLFFSQYEEIDATVKEFKNTALAHLNIRTTDQVTSLPQIYGIYKLLKIKVPSNYDPETHIYDGLWDGTFKLAWTDNPAWCLYDLIVNDRYGVNAYYPVTPDKWDFYEAGRYCDEMVDDGKGGREPRYTFNYLITDSQPGPEMLNYVAGTFNAILYEDSMGLLRLMYEDNEKQAVQIFNSTNITTAGFSYSFTDPSTRYNDYTVTFLNPNLDWEEDRRRVITPYGEDNIEKYGRIPFDFNAIGCIKESEAIRKAKFHLITSLKETMSVSFVTNRAAMNVNLFDTILVADKDMNYSQSGRIKSLSEDRSTVYLRDNVFIEADCDYVFRVQTSYNVFSCNVITNELGNVKELKLDESLPDNIDEKAVFTLSGTNDSFGSAKPFRVVSISESQGNLDEITITATEIHRLKQYEADTGVELADLDYSTRQNFTIIPHIKKATFEEYYNSSKNENALRIGIELNWEAYPYYTGSFVVYSRLKDSDDPSWIKRNVEDGDIIYSHPIGLYEFKILPATTLGLYPSIDTAPVFDFQVHAVLLNNPASVDNFKAEGTINNIHLTWNKVQDAVRYELRLGENWDTADIISSSILPSNGLTEEFYYTDVTDDNSYKFMIKAVNVVNLYSEYASVAYGKLKSPDDVKKFYITPNLDSLRFDWVGTNENNVSYEVRIGADPSNNTGWESATKLFVTQGDNQTVLNPGFNEDTYFYIKAISSKGVYSQNALWGKIKQNLKQNRNVILKIDNAEGKLNYFVDSPEEDDETLTPWYGITHGLLDAQAGTKVMSDGYFNSEHFFPIHLPNNNNENDTIARNWYDVEFFSFGERLKWEDLIWSWDSQEAKSTSWLNQSDSELSGGEIEPLITIANPPSSYNNYLGLRFNSTTSDVTETTNPTVSYKVRYVDGKFDKGLAVYKAMKLQYSIDLDYTFSFRFKVYLNYSNPDYMKLIRLSNSDNTKWIDIYFENSQIKVLRSDNLHIEDGFFNESYLDYMFIMITQTDEKLYLDYFIEYANIRKRLELECEPLEKFTKLYFGSRYD